MKIRGQKRSLLRRETVVFERPQADDPQDRLIAFSLSGIEDQSEFDRIYPAPVAPQLHTANGQVPDEQDKEYLAALEKRNRARGIWLLLSSIQLPEGWEWDKVKPADPATWSQMDQDLADAGLSPAEIGELFEAATRVLGIRTDEQREEARKRFFSSTNTPAGTP